MSRTTKTTKIIAAKSAEAAALAATEKARSAVIAEIDARLDGTAPAAKGGKAPKTGKPQRSPKVRGETGLSALDAAVQALAASTEPMRTQELVDQMAKSGL